MYIDVVKIIIAYHLYSVEEFLRKRLKREAEKRKREEEAKSQSHTMENIENDIGILSLDLMKMCHSRFKDYINVKHKPYY